MGMDIVFLALALIVAALVGWIAAKGWGTTGLVLAIVGAIVCAVVGVMGVYFSSVAAGSPRIELSENVIYCVAAHVDRDKYLLREPSKNTIVFIQTDKNLPKGCFVKMGDQLLTIEAPHATPTQGQ